MPLEEALVASRERMKRKREEKKERKEQRNSKLA
jgi:hypothetical protein